MTFDWSQYKLDNAVYIRSLRGDMLPKHLGLQCANDVELYVAYSHVGELLVVSDSMVYVYSQMRDAGAVVYTLH